MKFILNTAVDPHFCALFDSAGKLIECHKWTNRRRDGAETFDFLESHKAEDLKINFCGGVAGPGGFSSLRAGAGILNALAFAKKIPVHQVRADRWIAEFLGSKDFVLNSFGDGVWVLESGELIRMPVGGAAEKFSDTPIFVGLLPPEKRGKFKKTLDVSLERAEKVLLEVLEKTQPQEIFHPDYEFPPV